MSSDDEYDSTAAPLSGPLDKHIDLAQRVQSLEAQLAAAETLLASREKDKARLDWLGYELVREEHEVTHTGSVRTASLFRANQPITRAAIDAAIAAAQPRATLTSVRATPGKLEGETVSSDIISPDPSA
jgi:hypothetical protein